MIASPHPMGRKLKRKVDRRAAKVVPPVDEDAIIERNAAFSAVFNEWGEALLSPSAAASDAVATGAGDFAGQLWNLASGTAATDEIVAALLRTPARSAAGDAPATALRTEAIVRELVAARRARFGSEARQVEAVVLQHLGGRRFYLALPVGWDAELVGDERR